MIPVAFEYVDGTLAVGQGFVVVKGTKFEKQAAMLVNNTLDPELQLIFARFSKYPPSNRNARLPDDMKRVAIPPGALDRAATLDYSKVAKHQAAYLMAVGGAAYLVSKAIRSARVVAFEDLGMEAIYEFEVRDMPVTVAVDARGESVHTTGPEQWVQLIRSKGISTRVA